MLEPLEPVVLPDGTRRRLPLAAGADRFRPGGPRPPSVRTAAAEKDRQPPNAAHPPFVPTSAEESLPGKPSGRHGRGAAEVTLPPWRLP